MEHVPDVRRAAGEVLFVERFQSLRECCDSGEFLAAGGVEVRQRHGAEGFADEPKGGRRRSWLCEAFAVGGGQPDVLEVGRTESCRV